MDEQVVYLVVSDTTVAVLLRALHGKDLWVTITAYATLRHKIDKSHVSVVTNTLEPTKLQYSNARIIA